MQYMETKHSNKWLSLIIIIVQCLCCHGRVFERGDAWNNENEEKLY